MFNPAQALTLAEYQCEIKDSISTLTKESKKLKEAYNSLSERDKAILKNTSIGGEGMSEEDILILGNDMLSSALEKYVYYIEHLKKPIKKDAVGGLYR